MEIRLTRSRAHDDGIDAWEVTEALPDPRLRGHVARYSSYWERTSSFAARRELAATTGVLIYALADPLEIVGADGRAIVLRTGEAFIGGIADGTSISRALGPQDGIHIFMPLPSLAAVAGAPLAELANCVAPLADLIGAAAGDLGGKLCEANSTERRFALLDAFLLRRFADAREPDRTALWAMKRLAAAHAPVSSALAEEIGWSRKHLARRFRAVTGFAPDRFRRIARFERFVEELQRRPEDLAGLAIETGYTDQPHLSRDVRDFSGMTPGELRARLIPAQGGVRDD